MDQPTEASSAPPARRGSILLTILGWAVGLPSVLLGLVSIPSMPAAAFWMVVFGLLVFPPVHNITERRFGFRLPWGVRAVGVFLSLIAFASIAPTPSTPRASTPATSASAAAPAASATDAEPPAVPVATAAPQPPANAGPIIGDQFRLGSFTYRITDASATRVIQNAIGGESAGPNATFIIVEYEITNEGNETYTGFSDDFEILDGQGRKFRTSSSGTTAFMMAGNNKDFILSELHPGITKIAAQIFEVPETVLGNVRLRVPEKGMFSSGEVIVNLMRTRTPQ